MIMLLMHTAIDEITQPKWKSRNDLHMRPCFYQINEILLY